MPGVEEAWDEDDEPISLGGDAPERDDRELGPDERDLDLMDGSWEQDYYSGGRRSVDWHAVTVGLALLVLLGLLVPVIEVFFR